MRDRTKACLLGIRIGDALGQPVETMNRQEIRNATVPGKLEGEPVSTFLDPIQTKIPDTRVLKKGDWTDDYQLTEVVTSSYIVNGEFNLAHMARSHVQALRDSKISWGCTTQKAIEQIQLWYDTEGREGRNPASPLPPQPMSGAGNGVAMKVAPLGLFYGIRGTHNDARLFSEVSSLAALTHSHPHALFSAYALALVLARIIRTPINKPSESIALLEDVIWEVSQREGLYGDVRTVPNITMSLTLLLQRLGDEERIYRDIGPGFAAIESVVYAIGIFLTHPTNFPRAVLTAVNDGWDSDTTTSMIGGMVGANCGLEAIPRGWRLFRPEYSSSLDLGIRLYEAAQRSAIMRDEGTLDADI